MSETACIVWLQLPRLQGVGDDTADDGAATQELYWKEIEQFEWGWLSQ